MYSDNEISRVKEQIQNIRKSLAISNLVYRQGQALYTNGQCQILSQSKHYFEFLVDDAFEDFEVTLQLNGSVESECTCKSTSWCQHKIAGLLQLHDEIARSDDEKPEAGKAYTRPGMIKRVMDERLDKAKKAEYHIEFADNIHGEHILLNEQKKPYKITFRDIEKEVGYCTCPDFQTNKLGTCKHLMYAFDYMKTTNRQFREKSQNYPFVEIFLDPLNDYKISWFYPRYLDKDLHELLNRYFNGKKYIEDTEIIDFLGLIQEAYEFKQIYIRNEVYEKIERAYNRDLLEKVKSKTQIDEYIPQILRDIKLFPYQKEGIEFATFREGAIIADEMGLGKTIQAITTAILKKKFFDFTKTLVVCPASLKEQWKREIEKFTHEKAVIADGFPNEREEIYKNSNAYFIIINYETVLRDKIVINKNAPDLIILDEAQRIKNYETLTANAIRGLYKKHALVITGTPIENKLIDLYSIVSFVDKTFLTPLWEFSYQHCYFDQTKKNKITGYYNLQELKERLSKILIRREKKDVIMQLPNISHLDIPVEMDDLQKEYHANFAKGISQIIHKKFLTPFDMQRLMLLMQQMRMVCDSTYLIDLETNISPKLKELEYVLLDKLNLKNSKRKVIIFSEWKRMNHIIGKMLRKNNIAFTELSGSVPVKKRGALIREFEENENCKVFISTEAGGSGLNLQVADTVINFELPWNPAKKNQRIGRIDRIGQREENLTVISFITKNSIEERIATGLLLKQNLFESVLSPNNQQDTIDFTKKGRAQFLQQIESVISEFEEEMALKEEVAEKTISDVTEIAQEYSKFPKQQRIAFENDENTDTNEPEKSQDEDVPANQIVEVLPEPENVTVLTESENTQEQLPTANPAPQEVETVLNSGLDFISGIFKMATGKTLSTSEQSITIDKETGEVTMKFKLPM